MKLFTLSNMHAFRIKHSGEKTMATGANFISFIGNVFIHIHLLKVATLGVLA